MHSPVAACLLVQKDSLEADIGHEVFSKRACKCWLGLLLPNILTQVNQLTHFAGFAGCTAILATAPFRTPTASHTAHR